MTSFPDLLKAIFSPQRRLADAERPILQKGGLLGRREWVVPRAHTSYRRFDLAALPPRKRLPAARIAALRDQPGGPGACRIAWKDGIAHVWSWAMPEAFEANRLNWLPESLLIGPTAPEGFRLLSLAIGVEGQVWQGGQLVASQWWASRPSTAAWHRFLRSAGVPPESSEAVPRAEPVPIGTAWAVVRGRRAGPTGAERWGWRLLGGGLAFAFGWSVAAGMELADSERQLEEVTASLRARATPLLEARERADAARVDIERYRLLQRAYDDYALMAQVVAALPPDTRLVSWSRYPELPAHLKPRDAGDAL